MTYMYYVKEIATEVSMLTASTKLITWTANGTAN